jgi:hypothetical protein
MPATSRHGELAQKHPAETGRKSEERKMTNSPNLAVVAEEDDWEHTSDGAVSLFDVTWSLSAHSETCALSGMTAPIPLSRWSDHAPESGADAVTAFVSFFTMGTR